MKFATLYRYYDDSGRLLYVGITGTGLARSHGHASTAAWWLHAAAAKLQHGPADSILVAERLAILVERPMYNRAGRMTERRRLEMLARLEAGEHGDLYIDLDETCRILGLTRYEVRAAMRWGFLTSDFARVPRFAADQLLAFIGPPAEDPVTGPRILTELPIARVG
jgi:hypothetical protein